MAKKSNKKSESSESKKRSPVRDVIRLAAFALAIAAIVKELKIPTDKRTWHGAVAGVVPYDFRRPTFERFKQQLWNPEGPLLSRQVFGVGWTMNFGALVAKVRSLR